VSCVGGVKTPCLAGTFSPAGSYTCSPCGPNTFSGPRAGFCESTNNCPAGHYCANGIKNTCPAGYFCVGAISVDPRIDTSTTNPYKCPSGKYCPAGTSTAIDCRQGYYCPTPDVELQVGPNEVCVKRQRVLAGRSYVASDLKVCATGEIAVSTCPTGFTKGITVACISMGSAPSTVAPGSAPPQPTNWQAQGPAQPASSQTQPASSQTQPASSKAQQPVIPEYDNGKIYKVNDFVQKNGIVYKMIDGIGAAGYPPPRPTNWQAQGPAQPASSQTQQPVIPEYDNGKVYKLNDVVKKDGIVYRMIDGIGAAGYPPPRPTNWRAEPAS